jgi:hypothetical protein
VGIRKPGQVDQSELRSLQNRATTAERRMNVAQNQLAAAEEKLASVNQKTLVTDGKWEARVKEYESRLKAAEEKVKRERQGAKETHLQLENTIKYVLLVKLGETVSDDDLGDCSVRRSTPTSAINSLTRWWKRTSLATRPADDFYDFTATTSNGTLLCYVFGPCYVIPVYIRSCKVSCIYCYIIQLRSEKKGCPV